MKSYKIMVLAFVLAFTACTTRQELEDPPIVPVVPVTISAEARQEFAYDGKPKTVVFSVDQDVKPSVAYYRAASVTSGLPVNNPPIERGVYLILIFWAGDAHYMGASKEVELVIK